MFIQASPRWPRPGITESPLSKRYKLSATSLSVSAPLFLSYYYISNWICGRVLCSGEMFGKIRQLVSEGTASEVPFRPVAVPKNRYRNLQDSNFQDLLYVDRTRLSR